MADVLSQSEIDTLLSALNSGDIKPEEIKEEEKQKVKVYDFRSPQKFSKDHIRTLELIHDNYARTISNYLTGQIRNTVKVKIEYVEQTTYEEFIHSIPNPTILTLFKMPPLSGTLLFETNPQFVFQIVDILLGGSGNGKYKAREFTDIDKNIISKINQGMIANLKLAWTDIMNVEPEMENIETNPALNQTLAPHEPVALITFSVEVGTQHSFINMCIPYLSIEKHLEKLVFQYWYQTSDSSETEDTRSKIEKNLEKVEVPISAVLGSTSITVDDFLRLSMGDIITLNQKCDEPVKIFLEDKPHLIGKPGLIGKKIGIQIIDFFDKDVNNDG